MIASDLQRIPELALGLTANLSSTDMHGVRCSSCNVKMSRGAAAVYVSGRFDAIDALEARAGLRGGSYCLACAARLLPTATVPAVHAASVADPASAARRAHSGRCGMCGRAANGAGHPAPGVCDNV